MMNEVKNEKIQRTSQALLNVSLIEFDCLIIIDSKEKNEDECVRYKDEQRIAKNNNTK